MTPQALYSGARDAIRLARACDRDMRETDSIAWAFAQMGEAARHRRRARRYLVSRRRLLDGIYADHQREILAWENAA